MITDQYTHTLSHHTDLSIFTNTLRHKACSLILPPQLHLHLPGF